MSNKTTDFTKQDMSKDENDSQYRPIRLQGRKREQQKRKNRREGKTIVYQPIEWKVFSLKEVIINLTKASEEGDRYAVLYYVNEIVKEAKNPNSIYNDKQISYAKKRIIDSLVNLYREEILKAYTSIKYKDYYISNVPENFTEDPYEGNTEAMYQAKAKEILMDRYRMHEVGAYMHSVINRIIYEYEHPEKNDISIAKDHKKGKKVKREKMFNNNDERNINGIADSPDYVDR